MGVSLKTLLLEAAEDRGYVKGYRDGSAAGRARGREQGIKIAKRQIAKTGLSEGLTLEAMAKVTGLPMAILESLLLNTRPES